jgi:hypothetical protein
MSRILYFCPDFPQPSGGTKTLYRHVWRLRQLGFEAAIVHQRRGFVLTWHGYEVPILWLEDHPQFGQADICIFPEVMLDFIRQTQGFRGQRVVIALSWAPAYNRLRPGERWQDYGITQVMAKSPVIKRYLKWSMGIDVTLIHEYVDAIRYVYDPALKKPTIAYMTRKDATGEWLHGVLARKGEPFTAFTWLPLRGMDEAIYAQHLREATVYLATTMQEGMHVSVLEAMACGCLVVGYAGVGGHVYMVGEGDRQNCVLVENGNLPMLGETLEQVLLNLHIDHHHYDRIINNAVRSTQPYQDMEAEARDLKTFFERFSNS